nr:solute carrier family 25 member 27 [Myotis myotis]
MQGEAALARLGDSAREATPYRGMVRTALGIVQEEGFLRLWQGVTPAIYRHCTLEVEWSHMNISVKLCFAKMKISIIPFDLTTYDTVKHYLVLNTTLEDNIMTHSLSSFCSGLVASILGTPADVIKSRIMNQPRDKQGRGLLYKSSTDCLIQAVQGEGFMSLYKGFLPSWLRMTPWSLVFWLTYEKIREMSGVNPF